MFKIVNRTFQMLDRRGKSKILFLTVVRLSVTLLDLVGVATTGLLISIGLKSVSSSSGGFSQEITHLLKLDKLSISNQVGCIGVAIVILFTTRIFLTYWFTKSTIEELVKQEIELSKDIGNRLFFNGLLNSQAIDSAQAAHIFTSSATSAVRIVGLAISCCSELFALSCLTILMAIVSPLATFVTGTFFGLTSFFSIRYFGIKTENASKQMTNLHLEATRNIQEIFLGYRELAVSGKLLSFTNSAIDKKISSAKHLKNVQIFAIVPRLLLDGALVVGIFLAGGLIWLSEPNWNSLSIFGIFLASSSRIIPSLAGFISGISTIQYETGSANRLYAFLDSCSELSESIRKITDQMLKQDHSSANAVPLKIAVRDLSFKYRDSNSSLLTTVDLTISEGEFVGIVGPSGVGKTTLIDLILGLIEPISGSVEINGTRASVFTRLNPGFVAYVSQSNGLFDGSIIDNITYRRNDAEVSADKVIESLEMANLSEFVSQLPLGMNTIIGERGAYLSGGQRQRLGIARALYQNARFLVLDESTNALDSENEFLIFDLLKSLNKKMTVVVIAHNVEILEQYANKIISMEEHGVIVSRSK